MNFKYNNFKCPTFYCSLSQLINLKPQKLTLQMMNALLKRMRRKKPIKIMASTKLKFAKIILKRMPALMEANANSLMALKNSINIAN